MSRQRLLRSCLVCDSLRPPATGACVLASAQDSTKSTVDSKHFYSSSCHAGYKKEHRAFGPHIGCQGLFQLASRAPYRKSANDGLDSTSTRSVHNRSRVSLAASIATKNHGRPRHSPQRESGHDDSQLSGSRSDPVSEPAKANKKGKPKPVPGTNEAAKQTESPESQKPRSCTSAKKKQNSSEDKSPSQGDPSAVGANGHSKEPTPEGVGNPAVKANRKDSAPQKSSKLQSSSPPKDGVPPGSSAQSNGDQTANKVPVTDNGEEQLTGDRKKGTRSCTNNSQGSQTTSDSVNGSQPPEPEVSSQSAKQRKAAKLKAQKNKTHVNSKALRKARRAELQANFRKRKAEFARLGAERIKQKKSAEPPRKQPASRATGRQKAKSPQPVPRRSTLSKRFHQLFAEAKAEELKSIEAGSLRIDALDLSNQPPIPNVQYGLDRVLFNPGVHQLQDHRTRVYNFDPYLEHIMPVEEFDFNSLKKYKTSSADSTLSQLAKSKGQRYVGSTSSMTGVLAHFHYLLSNWRDLDLRMLSRGFPEDVATFTNLNKAPNAIFLRYQPESATYAIDVDKEHDTPNVLMLLGKSMELFLTKPREEYERHRRGVAEPITEAERSAPESYQYTNMGGLLMRSQLDARDARLPGTGTFDLKTRAVMSVRMDARDWEHMSGYELKGMQGKFESYEREQYDMLRSTLLKYSLQVRMGCMDGIFMAYHNVRRVFGFQYIPISEMDLALHGQYERCLGDQEFKVSLALLNKILDEATAKFPERSLRIFFVTDKQSVRAPTTMTICAEPIDEAAIEALQAPSRKLVDAFERQIMGEEDTPDKADTLPEQHQGRGEEPTEADTGAVAAKLSDGPSDELAKRSAKSIEGPETETTEPKSDIYVAKLVVQNQVKYPGSDRFCDVKENRPVNLKERQTWKVNYLLREQDVPVEKKWVTYAMIRKRRKDVFDKLRKDEETAASAAEGEAKKGNVFMENLRNLAQKGRKYRAKLDAMEAGNDKVVLDRPNGTSTGDP